MDVVVMWCWIDLLPSRLSTLLQNLNNHLAVAVLLRLGDLRLGDLHEHLRASFLKRRKLVLGCAPVVHIGSLVGAGDSAVGRTMLLHQELTADVIYRVFQQRNSWNATLLRTVMHQAIFADIKIAGARAAAPIVGLAHGNVFLEFVEPRVAGAVHGFHLLIDRLLARGQGLELPNMVMNDANRRGEA